MRPLSSLQLERAAAEEISLRRVHQPLDVRVARRLTRGRNPMSESCGDWAGDRAAVLGLEQSTDGVQPSWRNAGEFCCAWELGRVAWCGCRLPRGEILGVPVLVPVRASPVPSVVRGSFVVKFSADPFAHYHTTRREVGERESVSEGEPPKSTRRP